MEQFYLTLPSDSSAQYYPENTTTSFKTKLSERIELNGEYEVGLAQLIYPNSWFNFYNNDESMWVSVKNKDNTFTKHIFPSGQFNDGSALARHLNEKIKIPGIMFHWHQFTRRMKLGITEGNLLVMSPAFKAYVGFEEQEEVLYSGKYYSRQGFDLLEHLRLMYIYCDIASYSCVGDVRAPLLRVCDTEGLYGQTVRLIFTHPHYIPIARTSFDDIEILIRNEIGQAIPFEFGKAVVTLHLRHKL